MVVMAGLAMAWVPVLKEMNAGQLFLYLNEVQNYLAPPLAAVFLLAIFWPRFNEKVINNIRAHGLILVNNV